MFEDFLVFLKEEGNGQPIDAEGYKEFRQRTMIQKERENLKNNMMNAMAQKVKFR